ncbi:MAG: amino acid ABC transporter substrate-binding protein [Chroococcidiopsidaceae cyanobacterium CP_BM_RX_35]|nr:amino acid ABC transporter substrate-binding protein [Chroococcidiopsidaceae cyanobacterium CP_BM_RX_35]
MPGYLEIAASDFNARPMSYLKQRARLGYEPDLTRVVCDRIGLEPVWHNLPMADFYPCLQTGGYDVIWFNQAITKERTAWADFTRPYGLFDEAVIVQANSPIYSPDDLSSLRVGGLADSTNLTLARSFAGVEIVPFPGSDQVLPEMLEALRAGEIDALIDDELVLIVAAEEDPNLRIAFSVPTQVPFGIAVRRGQMKLLQALNATLDALIADGSLAQLWAHWVPWKPFPF